MDFNAINSDHVIQPILIRKRRRRSSFVRGEFHNGYYIPVDGIFEITLLVSGLRASRIVRPSRTLGSKHARVRAVRAYKPTENPLILADNVFQSEQYLFRLTRINARDQWESFIITTTTTTTTSLIRPASRPTNNNGITLAGRYTRSRSVSVKSAARDLLATFRLVSVAVAIRFLTARIPSSAADYFFFFSHRI